MSRKKPKPPPIGGHGVFEIATHQLPALLRLHVSRESLVIENASNVSISVDVGDGPITLLAGGHMTIAGNAWGYMRERTRDKAIGSIKPDCPDPYVP